MGKHYHNFRRNGTTILKSSALSSHAHSGGTTYLLTTAEFVAESAMADAADGPIFALEKCSTAAP
jgi:hypothetical protein